MHAFRFWSKKTNEIVGNLRYQAVFMAVEVFRSFWADGLCGQMFFFHIWFLDFVFFFVLVSIGAPYFFCMGECFW